MVPKSVHLQQVCMYELFEQSIQHSHSQSHHAISLLVDDAPLVGLLTSKYTGGNADMKL